MIRLTCLLSVVGWAGIALVCTLFPLEPRTPAFGYSVICIALIAITLAVITLFVRRTPVVVASFVLAVVGGLLFGLGWIPASLFAIGTAPASPYSWLIIAEAMIFLSSAFLWASLLRSHLHRMGDEGLTKQSS